ncbi:MAG: thioredoxin domain-containing protein, partial [Chloroflexi bacterium]
MSGFHFSPRPNRAAEIGWREWSPEAFEQAKAEDRPILLSISAVWCHWCHVMDETTYSNQGRVDNDLRPDINSRYNMGGWPSTVFLTPQGDILTGATYLPPDQMAGALQRVGSFYRGNKPQVVSQVLENRKRSMSVIAASAGSLDPRLVAAVVAACENAYDQTYGGFGGSPKFPQADALALLAEQSTQLGDPRLLEMARFTLRQMAGGGTYDHVEGGFFRYSTTQDWSVPHFEKMLEDHALLVTALALTGEGEILDSATAYLDSVLRDPGTGLYGGSQDADEHYYSLDADGRRALEPPYVDRRVYSNWNCMLAVGYLEADARLGRPKLRENSVSLLARLIADRYSIDGGMLHTEDVGGQLGDQAWALLAAVRAFQAGAGAGWLQVAEQVAEHLESAYADPDFGGYFDHAAGDKLGRLEERLKPIGENAVV